MINFPTPPNTPNVSFTSTNDFAGTYVLNQLNFTSTGTGSVTLAGNAFQFAGGAAALTANTTNANTVSAPLTLGVATSFTNTGAGLLTVSGGVTLGANVLTVGGTTNTTLSGVLSGTGRVVKNGAGVLALNGASTFGGGVTLNAGTLSLGNNAGLGTGTLTVAAINTTVNVTGTAATFANNIALLNAAGRVTFATPNNSTTTLNGTISGGAASTDPTAVSGTEFFFLGGAAGQNTGALRINGSNTGWQGTLNVQRGPLILGNANAAGSTVIRLDSNLPPAGALQLAGDFTVANRVFLQSAAAQTVGVGAGLTAGLSGTIASNGNIGLTKVGTGTLVLSGTNTYGGPTTVAAGQLVVASSGATSSGPVAVSSGATLGGTGSIGGTTTVNAGGTIRGDSDTGTGTLTLGNVALLGGTGSTGARLATRLTTTGSAITANSTLAVGANTFNLDVTGGKINIVLLNDDALERYIPYSITLVSGGSNSFLRNGTPWDAATNPFTVDDFNLVSGSGLQGYYDVSLVVSNNNLVVSFSPVPEPVTVLAIGAAGLGLAGLVRRKRKAVAVA